MLLAYRLPIIALHNQIPVQSCSWSSSSAIAKNSHHIRNTAATDSNFDAVGDRHQSTRLNNANADGRTCNLDLSQTTTSTLLPATTMAALFLPTFLRDWIAQTRDWRTTAIALTLSVQAFETYIDFRQLSVLNHPWLVLFQDTGN